MILDGGVVCWRLIQDVPYVLVIHRNKRDDYSLPKGKQDPGESLPETAVRELGEETCVSAPLGPYLDQVDYRAGDHPKRVHYWTTQVGDDRARAALRDFQPNREVDEILWVTVEDAQKMLTFPHDRELIRGFAAKLPGLTGPSYRIVVARHAKSTPRADWKGAEPDRPLTDRGLAQAASLASLYRVWGPYASVISSPWKRCVQTVDPYLETVGASPDLVESLSEGGYEADPIGTEQLAGELASQHRSLLICSHRPVLPAVIGAIGALADDETRARLLPLANLDPGCLAVLHLTASPDGSPRVVSSEMHAPWEES